MRVAVKNNASPCRTYAPDDLDAHRSLLAPAVAAAFAVTLTSLAVRGRERVSKARSSVWYLPGFQIGQIHVLDSRPVEEIRNPTSEQLTIEADMFIRAGQRARKEIEDSGWVSDEDLEMHTNAILLGRQAEATCKDAGSPSSRSASMENVTRAYESFLANSQLCRQVLDKEPSQEQTLLDIHVAACINLNKLRDAYRGLAATIPTCEPHERFPSEQFLAGARHCLEDLYELFQSWEEVHGPTLKEAHGRNAAEILRRSQQSAGMILQGEGGLRRLHFQPHEILSKEEELELGRKIEEAKKAYKELSEFGWKCKKGRSELVDAVRTGQSAKCRLALMNLRLVASIALQVERRFQSFAWSSLTLEDLLQEGDVGLLAAVEKYDWRRGYRFSTFATWSIRQAMRKAIFDKGSAIRIPIARREQMRKLKLAERAFWMEHERKPTIEELSDLLGFKKSVVKNVKEISDKGNRIQELDASRRIGNSLTGTSQLSSLRDSAASPMETLEEQEEQERMSSILSLTMQKLSKEELIAIGMRYGLNGRDKADYNEIADVLSISSSRDALQLVSRGVTKLRRAVTKQRWTGMDDLGSKSDQAMLHSMYSNLMMNPPLSHR
jgi:RNA polymerase primary sigma factor